MTTRLIFSHPGFYLALWLCFLTASGSAQEIPVQVGTFLQEQRQFLDADTFTQDRWQSYSVENSARCRRIALTELPEGLISAVDQGQINSACRTEDSQIYIGMRHGLFHFDGQATKQIFPRDSNRRWAPTNVQVAIAPDQSLWFSSEQGAGRFDKRQWQLFDGSDGLPVETLAELAVAPDNSIWFASQRGAVRFDGEQWYYRQGPRWLPDDHVQQIVIADSGDVYLETADGVAKIYFTPTTLAEKAEFYEQQIDLHHRRTSLEYVINAQAAEPGSKRNLTLNSSDNDGLWTSMYGAGECFAYAATKSPEAKRRAQQAFEALRFLSKVTEGCQHEPPRGFIARSVIPVAEASQNPNSGSYSLQGQRRKRKYDGLWRVYEPRWPKSADGKYYWKSDTSSDELDGHYFFYPLYYDLVAETEEQKAAAREIVRANIDHLIAHDFSMHDHAGRTRWAVYGPKEMNQDPEWFNERGLKSLSILSYLNVAFHMTDDPRYREIAAELRDKHSYHQNVMWPKYQRGIGSGNQSDDEMAFMCYYNLIKYEPDPELRKMYLASFANSWRQEEPEMNPFFNFCFAALARGESYTSVWGEYDLSPWPSWLEDSLETLRRFPLDRFDWPHRNSQRADLVTLSDHWADVFDAKVSGRGYRVNGKVIPVDERSFNHWNHDPWQLNTGNQGRSLGTGAVYTLPYYMGLYYGFIAPDAK